MSESRWKTAEERLREQLVALEGENVTLKQRLDGAAQIIAMRTADVATLKQERDYHRTAHDSATIRISQLTRRLSELHDVEAERDRIRQALKPFVAIAEAHDERIDGRYRWADEGMWDVPMLFCRRAALALSPSETEEGG